MGYTEGLVIFHSQGGGSEDFDCRNKFYQPLPKAL